MEQLQVLKHEIKTACILLTGWTWPAVLDKYHPFCKERHVLDNYPVIQAPTKLLEEWDFKCPVRGAIEEDLTKGYNSIGHYTVIRNGWYNSMLGKTKVLNSFANKKSVSYASDWG